MKRITVLFGTCLAALLVQSAMAQSAMTQSSAKSSAASSSVQEACADDFKKLCPDAQPGDKAMHNCLKAHSKDVSAGCKDAMKAHKGHHTQEQSSEPKSE